MTRARSKWGRLGLQAHSPEACRRLQRSFYAGHPSTSAGLLYRVEMSEKLGLGEYATAYQHRNRRRLGLLGGQDRRRLPDLWLLPEWIAQKPSSPSKMASGR